MYETFFNNHNIEIFPIHLFLQLGNIKTIKIKTGTMQNIEFWSDLIMKSELYILAV
jgi:hypothetical protein